MFTHPEKRALLFISPVHPSSGGAGLAMRALAVLKALQRHYRVYLLVIDPWSQDGLVHSSTTDQLETIDVPIGLFRRPSNLKETSVSRRLTPPEWPLLTTDQSAFLVSLEDRLNFVRVHVFRLYMAPFATPFLGRIPCQLDLDEIESQTRLRHADLCTRTGQIPAAHAYNLTAQFYESIERAWLDKFEVIFVSSELAERDLVQRHAGVHTRVLPNVVKVPAVLPPLPLSNMFTLLFVGNMGYYPNRDAVDFLVSEIVPALRQVLGRPFIVKLVGSGELPKYQIDSFPPEAQWLGYVAELAPIYEQCHVVIVPIRSGGGTRIKILEAFAHSRPVVTTAMGAEGLPIVTDVHCLLADTVRSFAQACFRLQAEDSLRDRLSENAYLLVLEKFTQKRLEGLIGGPDPA